MIGISSFSSARCGGKGTLSLYSWRTFLEFSYNSCAFHTYNPCRKAGAPSYSFGCIPLESVIERVCIVRIPRKVVGKRGCGGIKMIDPMDDDKTSRYLVNNLVGPPPEELIPVVPEDVAEIVREETMELKLCPSQASLQLEDAMDAEDFKAWGWTPHSEVLTGINEASRR